MENHKKGILGFVLDDFESTYNNSLDRDSSFLYATDITCIYKSLFFTKYLIYMKISRHVDFANFAILNKSRN